MINGKRLKSLRKSANMIQADVAKYLNIERTTYVRYEKEELNPPTETVAEIAKLFNVTADYLLDLTDNPRRPEDNYTPTLEELIKNSSEMTEDFKFMMLTQLKLAKLAYKMDNEHAEQLETPREPIFKNGRRILAT